MKAASSSTSRTTASSPRTSPCRTPRASTPARCGCSIQCWGYLCRVDAGSGKAEQVAFCTGFARGLSFWRGYALVGTSLPRDGAFKGLELEANVKARDGEPRCGAYIIDTRQGDILHWIRFDGAVRELFDASFIPGVRAPMCVGLGNPEMRTLITFDGQASGLAQVLCRFLSGHRE